MADLINGEARLDIKVLQTKFINCQERSAEHRVRVEAVINRIEEQVGKMSTDLRNVEKELAVRTATLDSSSKRFVAVMMLIGALGGGVLTQVAAFILQR